LREYLRLLIRLKQERIEIAIDFRGDFRILLWFSWLAGARQRVGFTHLGGEFLLTNPCEYDPRKHFVDLNLDLLRSLNVPVERQSVRYVFLTSAKDQQDVEPILAQAGICGQERLIAIHPSTVPHWTLKRWTLEGFATVAGRLIAENGVTVIFTGGVHDEAYIHKITSQMRVSAVTLAGKTSLAQLAEVLRRCDMLITNDTGPMHLALAVDTPVVAIFGPTVPEKSGPYGQAVPYRVLTYPVPCRRPCFVMECPYQHACMRQITPDQVFQACQELLRIRHV
jgi:ADP-heptose:LPS heptosyltransferase